MEVLKKNREEWSTNHCVLLPCPSPTYVKAECSSLLCSLMSIPGLLILLQLSSFSAPPDNQSLKPILPWCACLQGWRTKLWVLTVPVSCPLFSPVCQTFSDATVLQTLTRLTPQLRLASSLLSELQSIPDFLSFVSLPRGSDRKMHPNTSTLFLRCDGFLTLRNWVQPNSYLIKEEKEKGNRVIFSLPTPPCYS